MLQSSKHKKGNKNKDQKNPRKQNPSNSRWKDLLSAWKVTASIPQITLTLPLYKQMLFFISLSSSMGEDNRVFGCKGLYVAEVGKAWKGGMNLDQRGKKIIKAPHWLDGRRRGGRKASDRNALQGKTL